MTAWRRGEDDGEERRVTRVTNGGVRNGGLRRWPLWFLGDLSKSRFSS
jgi:hypothetical protein